MHVGKNFFEKSFKEHFLERLRMEPESTFVNAGIAEIEIENNEDLMNSLLEYYQKAILRYDAGCESAFENAMMNICDIKIASPPLRDAPGFLTPTSESFNADVKTKDRIVRLANHISFVAQHLSELVYKSDTQNGNINQMFQLLQNDIEWLDNTFLDALFQSYKKEERRTEWK